MYNEFMYNEQTYNGPHTLHVQALADSNMLIDMTSEADVLKFLTDSLSVSEAQVFSVSQALIDFVFLSEFVRKEITNKALRDQIRLNDWLSISRPFVQYWHD